MVRKPTPYITSSWVSGHAETLDVGPASPPVEEFRHLKSASMQVALDSQVKNNTTEEDRAVRQAYARLHLHWLRRLLSVNTVNGRYRGCKTRRGASTSQFSPCGQPLIRMDIDNRKIYDWKGGRGSQHGFFWTPGMNCPHARTLARTRVSDINSIAPAIMQPHAMPDHAGP